ncbi:MAG: DUF2513 domain-containing protein [Chloroflexota bacterium]|nr:DUF2513 domain-containing protein [Chloroflexota bacterium]
MQRDMDLIREILLQVEAYDKPHGAIPIRIEGYSKEATSYHIGLLIDAGYLAGYTSGGTRDTHYAVRNLTWAGHEFLDAARNETVWNSTKQVVKEKGGAIPFDLLKDLLIKRTSAYFGLP